MSHTPSHLKVITTKTGALAATGIVATSIFASMPASNAVDTGSFGSVISASEAQTTTREVPVDNTALLTAVEKARAAGLTITEEQTKTITTGTTAEVQAALNTIAAETETKIAEINAAITQYTEDKAAVDARNATIKAKYEADLETYKAEKAIYDDLKAKYDAFVKEQTTGANIDTALTPDKLAYGQPFSLNTNRDSLDKSTVTGPYTEWELIPEDQRTGDFGGQPGDIRNVATGELGRSTWSVGAALYNSDRIFQVPVTDGDSGTVTWRSALTDTTSGRALDVSITYSEVDVFNASQSPAVTIYSNFVDNFGLWQLDSMKQTINVTYADDGSPYEKNFYTTFASLNSAGDKGVSESSGAEYASIADRSKVLATFTHKDTWISKEAVDSTGNVAEAGISKLWRSLYDQVRMGNELGVQWGDETEGSFKYLGVTFLNQNGASFYTGTQWDSAKHYEEFSTSGVYQTNHVQMSLADMVLPTENEPVEPKPPVEPKYEAAPPAPEISYSLTKLFAPIPVVEKVAKDEGKKVMAGETTTQTVSYATGYKAPESFVLGDHIYFTEDGRMPVSVNMDDIKVTDETGADVTELFTITAEDGTHQGKAGHQILATAKNPGQLKLNHTYTLHINQTSLFDGVADTLMDAGFAIINDELQYTTDKTYQEPTITPSKVDTSAVDGSNIDGKTVTVGDTISYKLVEDTTDLVNTTTAVKASGMVDDFDERYGDIDTSQVRIYQVPGDTDTSTPEAVSAAVKLAEAKDVTDSYTVTNGDIEDFTNGGAKGISSMMKTEGEGEKQKVVLPMGYKYIHVLPYTVTANTDGDILNTAWQMTNGARTQTETVANKLKEITPSKDVVINVGDKDSIDGAEIALNTVFNYQLNSSTLPAERAGITESWSIVDDYDETKDAYEGQFLVQNTRDFVDGQGKTVKAGSDMTEYFTQVHQDGKVTYTATEAFLELMSSEANRATEQGFTVFMQVQRIGTGEVENTFVENYNGEQLVSNTVKTFTPEPPVPPAVPEDPASVPPVPVTPEPAKPVIKGEGAKTGSEARVAGVPVAGLLTAGGVLLAGLVGAGAWLLVAGARKKNS